MQLADPLRRLPRRRALPFARRPPRRPAATLRGPRDSHAVPSPNEVWDRVSVRIRSRRYSTCIRTENIVSLGLWPAAGKGLTCSTQFTNCTSLGSTSDLAMEYRRCASSEWLWTLPLVIYRGLRYKEGLLAFGRTRTCDLLIRSHSPSGTRRDSGGQGETKQRFYQVLALLEGQGETPGCGQIAVKARVGLRAPYV